MMNKKEILSKAGGILTELNEQYEYLSRSPENLNELELELFSANASFLSDHLAILVKLNGSISKAETKPISSSASAHIEEPTTIENPDLEKPESDTKVDKPEVEDSKAELPREAPVEKTEQPSSEWKSEFDKEAGLTFDFEETQPDKLFDRPLTEDEKKVIDEKTKLRSDDGMRVELQESGIRRETPPVENYNVAATREEEVLLEEVQPKKGEEVTAKEEEDDVHVKEVVISERTIAVPSDQLRNDNTVPTVNDLLSRNITRQTVSSQFNTSQTKDLKGMISLNDKLLFVRDLFNGYSLAYSEAIELLNRFDNFEAADNFLQQNYAGKNNWSTKQDVADKFYEVLSRRFSK